MEIILALVVIFAISLVGLAFKLAEMKQYQLLAVVIINLLPLVVELLRSLLK
ncbi:hypothetical protein OZX69_07775 [Lactobacillus sp. ESL0731]|uniref:hypothetical protein n=1 Tax=unclassified Lactobacillus TaxID=2620435 RepID=UPI0023F6CF00|nr:MULTISPECIES: hypothetical protein [unclassified Lactobacillus]WEV50840.1 hypothetical protein OZX63_07770 [Lactobacillus sp. ESL0700]WEV61971.1 hypothetical protein OZX69_07775 [Lactobacillus sp. ESL0731]